MDQPYPSSSAASDVLVALTPVHGPAVARWVYWRSDQRSLTVHPERWRTVDICDPDALLLIRRVLSLDPASYSLPFCALAPVSFPPESDPSVDPTPAFCEPVETGEPVETVLDGLLVCDGLDDVGDQLLAPWFDASEPSPWLIDAMRDTELFPVPSCLSVTGDDGPSVLADELAAWALGSGDPFDDLLLDADEGFHDGALSTDCRLLASDWVPDPEIHGVDSREPFPVSVSIDPDWSGLDAPSDVPHPDDDVHDVPDFGDSDGGGRDDGVIDLDDDSPGHG